MVKNLPASAGDIRDMCSIPGWGRSPRGGHSNPLQCSWRENPMDRGAWWATVHGVAKTRTRLKQLSMHSKFSLRQGVTQRKKNASNGMEKKVHQMKRKSPQSPLADAFPGHLIPMQCFGVH